MIFKPLHNTLGEQQVNVGKEKEIYFLRFVRNCIRELKNEKNTICFYDCQLEEIKKEWEKLDRPNLIIVKAEDCYEISVESEKTKNI